MVSRLSFNRLLRMKNHKLDENYVGQPVSLKALRAQLAAAEAAAESARCTAVLAKANYKDCKRVYKEARKAAKHARKLIKAATKDLKIEKSRLKSTPRLRVASSRKPSGRKGVLPSEGTS